MTTAKMPGRASYRITAPRCIEVECSECPGCPTPYDVESRRPGLTLLVAAVLIVGTVLLSVLMS